VFFKKKNESTLTLELKTYEHENVCVTSKIVVIR